jgi:hypothetical protein
MGFSELALAKVEDTGANSIRPREMSVCRKASRAKDKDTKNAIATSLTRNFLVKLMTIMRFVSPIDLLAIESQRYADLREIIAKTWRSLNSFSVKSDECQ